MTKSKTNQPTKPLALTACPFCGNTEPSLFGHLGDFRVTCPTCAAQVSADTPQACAAAWNRRPHDGHTCASCAHIAHSYSGVAHCHNPHALIDIVKDSMHACPYYHQVTTPPKEATT